MNLQKKKVLISGWYGQSNAGDDALLSVFVEELTRRVNSEIAVLSERPEYVNVSAGIRSLFHQAIFTKDIAIAAIRGHLLKYIRDITNCDLFVLGGGSLLKDNTPMRTLFRTLDEIWLNKLLGHKVALYAIGTGPITTRIGKFIISNTLKLCDIITVRSAKDAYVLQNIGVPAAKINVVADPGFLIQAKPVEDRALLDSLSGKKKIGIFPALGLVKNGRDFSYADALALALDELVEKNQLEFIAFPMFVRLTELDDIQIARYIKSKMRHPEALHLYEKQLTPNELTWVAGQTLMNISIRLHGMIFSLAAGTPVVPISYSSKVQNVFAEVGCPEYLVEMDERLRGNLVGSVEKCLDDLESYSLQIHRFKMHAEKSAHQTFDLIADLKTGS